MLQEARKVRSGAERLDGEILARVGDDLGLGLDAFLGVGRERVHADFRAQPLTDGDAGFGIDDVGSDLVHQMLEVVAATDTQEAPLVGVRVDIKKSGLLQFARVRLGPLRRADEHRLFGVPARIDDGAPGAANPA